MTKPPDEVGSVGHVLGETRWDLLGELCRRAQTASELGEAVGTSANAVRVHLEALQRAGLVSYEVVRRGVGKPTHVYTLTSSGESLVSRAYAPALAAILAAARSRMNGGFLPMLRAAGIALGQGGIDGREERDGVSDAARLLESLGAPVDREQSGGSALLRVECCPLAAVTRQTPEVCAMMEAAVEAVSGMRTRHLCAPGSHPRCAFEITTAG